MGKKKILIIFIAKFGKHLEMEIDLCQKSILSKNFEIKCKFSMKMLYLFATPWTVACQAPLFMGFSRQIYCNGFPCPPPVNLFDPGIELESPTLQADSLLFKPPGKPVYPASVPSHCIQDISPSETDAHWKNRVDNILQELTGLMYYQVQVPTWNCWRKAH